MDLVSYLLSKKSGEASIEALSVTENGVYTAPEGVDGYSPVTVNVSGGGGGGGGASNIVTGTFKGTTTGAAMDVDLAYTGDGHPIAVMVYPAEGTGNTDGTYYNLVQRYAACILTAVKCIPETAPAYNYYGEGKFNLFGSYKNNASSSTDYGSQSYLGTNSTQLARGSNATTGNMGNILSFKSKDKMSVYIPSSGQYGFAANIEYKYWIIYSA